MNIKILYITAFIIIGVMPLFLSAQSDEMIINNVGVFKKHTRPLVHFSHFKHQYMDEVSCTDCHHIFFLGKNVLDPDYLIEGGKSIKCSYCHKSQSDLRQAYHKQCIACHDKYAKAGKKAGPGTCGECHVKRAAGK
ncbi:MAG: cytochrome c3 family protein [Spirochaetes bacterium]|nr:cytochrome c3 family protein [Spirochaetota bacterium]